MKHFKFGSLSIDPVELGSRGNAVLGIRDSGKTVSSASSGFEKNVSTLSGLGFVHYPVKGSVAALPILFVE